MTPREQLLHFRRQCLTGLAARKPILETLARGQMPKTDSTTLASTMQALAAFALAEMSHEALDLHADPEFDAPE